MKKEATIIKDLLEKLGTKVLAIESVRDDEVETFAVDTGGTWTANEEALRAVTTLVREIASRNGLPATFRVDIDDFEVHLKAEIEAKARMFAERARHFKGTVDLPHTDSFARRVMHAYIAREYPDLVTRSEGEGRERHLVIAQK